MSRVLAIVGPTAVGKTELALDLATMFDGEIINSDALQAYRGFDIGTAKPSPEERARVPHHLVDILDADQWYSAGEFGRRAREVIGDIESRNRLPLLVGGSGLYLRAALEGLSAIPESDPETRSMLRERLEEEGLESLRRELAEVDPKTAGRLAPGDTQRTLRALEVALSTGSPLSFWIAQVPSQGSRIDAGKIGLTLPRPLLYDRIAERVRLMVEKGWVEEVEGLLQKGIDPASPAFQAIGYRDFVAVLRGKQTLEEAIEKTIRATRRYAKRQMTWLRREQDIHWLQADRNGLDRGEVEQLLRVLGLDRKDD